MEGRRVQETIDRRASLPRKQFYAQVNEEMRRMWNTDPETSWMSWSGMPTGGTLEKLAIGAVKSCWEEQGIWRDKWDEMAAGYYMNVGRWKHEEPLELESESGAGTKEEPRSRTSLLGMSPEQSQSKTRRPKSGDEKRQVEERRFVREREREASRPYYQFVFQISKERERIQHNSIDKEGANVDIADINTRAYENVKNTWIGRGIWNRRWGILPGMSWKHEEPLEEIAHELIPIPGNPLENSSHEMCEPPRRRIFGSPPVISNHSPPSDPSANKNFARLESGDAKCIPSASDPPCSITAARVLRQKVRQSKRESCQKASQPQPPATVSLGPKHQSRVSKVNSGKTRPGRLQQTKVSQELTSGDPQLVSGPKIPEPQSQLASVTPRRSQRIELPESSRTKETIDIVSTGPVKGGGRSRPRRDLAHNQKALSSAKPRGITKRHRPNSARRKKGENS
jgi:hypothetical protein